MAKNIPVWLIVALVLILGFFVYGLLSNSTAESQKPPVLDEQSKPDTAESNTPNNGDVPVAPDFTLTDLDGNSITLADFKGKYLILNFFATWCGVCQAEMPELEKIYQDYQGKDLVVLAVNIGEDPDKVKDYLTANNYTLPVAFDQELTTAITYRVSSIPVTFFINEEGLIEGKHSGLIDYEQMAALLDKLLQ